MEKRGQVNMYTSKGGDPVPTINLADGTTPFVALFGGVEHTSAFYRVACMGGFTIAHAWFRPGRREFEALDASHQDHVLNGGLLCAELKSAMNQQIIADDVDADWDYERFQAWCLERYGKRRGPMETV